MSVSKAPQDGSVDRRQLRRNLMLTPEQRLRRMLAWQRWVIAHRGIARPPPRPATKVEHAESP